jgi:hypothetical protein
MSTKPLLFIRFSRQVTERFLPGTFHHFLGAEIPQFTTHLFMLRRVSSQDGRIDNGVSHTYNGN